MKNKAVERLKADIVRLRRLVARYPTGSLARMLALFQHKDPEAVATTNELSSPYRQVQYVLGLMLTTSEPRIPESERREVTDEILTRCFTLVESIFQYYPTLYIPDAPNANETGADFHGNEQWNQIRVAMVAFLNYQNTTRLMAGAEQLVERVQGTCVPFDDILQAQTGLSATDALRISERVIHDLQASIDASIDSYSRLSSVRNEFLAQAKSEGWSMERMFQEMQASETRKVVSTVLTRIDETFTVRRDSLESFFGADLTAAYWQRFVSHRGSSSPQAFTYPTDANPAEYRPLIELKEGETICSVGNALYWAVLLQMTEALTAKEQDKTVRNRYLQTRDKFLEHQVVDLLRLFFGPEATLLPSVYETPNVTFEHDLILLWKRQLLVIESKAGIHREPFRDPSAAYQRLKSEFKDNIQKGYEQADRIRQQIATAAAKGELYRLYNKNREVVLTIDPAAEIENVYCLCVTADNFGMLAADLSLLLTKPGDTVYPWCVNILDLENLLEGLSYRGWGPEELLQYLKSRASLHGKVSVTDELEIAGIFLAEGTLDPLIAAAASVDSVALAPDTARVFSDVYRALHQGGPAVDFAAIPRLRFHSFNQMMEQAVLEAMDDNTVAQKDNSPVSPMRGSLERSVRRLLQEGVTSPRIDRLRTRPVPFPDLMTQSTDRSSAENATSLETTAKANDPCPCGSGKKFKKCCRN